MASRFWGWFSFCLVSCSLDVLALFSVGCGIVVWLFVCLWGRWCGFFDGIVIFISVWCCSCVWVCCCYVACVFGFGVCLFACVWLVCVVSVFGFVIWGFRWCGLY